MALIVKKFGGTSVKDTECLVRVANIISADYKKGNDIVAVVSAQGDFTDELIRKSAEISPFNISGREKDMLLSSGEQISASLLAIAVENTGISCVSMLGWQAGIQTDSDYTSARIINIQTDRIKKELSKKRVVIVTGFQGIEKDGNITTLGRGGSDTSAVAIAAKLNADICQIYTDVDGIYSADPRKVNSAVKKNHAGYDEVLQMATLGAQVMNNRAVEMAEKYNVYLEVLSSITNESGTTITRSHKSTMESPHIFGVTKDCAVSKINYKADKVAVYTILTKLSDCGIMTDMITIISNGNSVEVNLVIPTDRLSDCISIMSDSSYDYFKHDESFAKISVIGIGIQSNTSIISDIIKSLSAEKITADLLSTGEMRISLLVPVQFSDKAVQSVHDRLAIY